MATPIEVYVSTLIDPFRVDQLQPKIFDNQYDFSNGVRFRSTGNITLDATGDPTYVVLFPGYSNSLAWKKTADATYLTHPVYANHMDSITNRGLVRSIRMVSCGLKLSLMNSADQNEGHWEAVRVPFGELGWVLSDTVAPTGEDWGLLPPSNFTANMANYRSFQNGKLKDLERFMFKLNSIRQTHRDFDTGSFSANLSSYNVLQADNNMDVIVLKLYGRVDVTNPSIVRYDVVSNQEVVYKEDTALYRLATPSMYIPEMDQILAASNFKMPAIQIM